MLGAIAGDIIGSVYEFDDFKELDFPLFQPTSRFTDDTVLTVAVAQTLLGDGTYRENLLKFGRRYPEAGYGGSFLHWLNSPNPVPYHSWGNGSAMRVGPVGFAFESIDEVLEEAQRSAEVTHDHPEGIKGAQAIALAVFLGRRGSEKGWIRAELGRRFGYDLDRSLDQIRPGYGFDVSCQGSVPEALIAFLESDSWEQAVRNAVSLGGDSDTQACIAGAVSEAFYGGVPESVALRTLELLPGDLREVTEEFCQRYADAGRTTPG